MAAQTANAVVAFCTDESGATTVAWVTLTAAGLAVLLSAFSLVSGGTENLTRDTAQQVANFDVANGFITPAPVTSSTDIVAR